MGFRPGISHSVVNRVPRGQTPLTEIARMVLVRALVASGSHAEAVHRRGSSAMLRNSTEAQISLVCLQATVAIVRVYCSVGVVREGEVDVVWGRGTGIQVWWNLGKTTNC